jgi:hypothetical protein
MSDIESSTRRLDAAVARLEAALAQNGGAGSQAAADLAALRRDFDSLRDTASGVSARLDTAIGRLKIVLGDEA